MRFALALLALALAVLLARGQDACGTPKVECPTDLGFYRLVLPERAAGPVPAVIYLHGWGGSSAGVMKNRAMRAHLSARGFALIMPEGRPTGPSREQKDWSVRDGSACHP